MTDRGSGAIGDAASRVRPARWSDPQPQLHGRVLFVAIPVHPAACAAVAALVASLPVPVDARPVRWVRLDGLHLTLRFLGPTSDDRIPDVEAAIAAAVTGQHPFRVSLRGAGAFPSLRRPRALWLGVDAGLDRIATIARLLDDELADRGWPRDRRPFRAHLTLARSDGVRAGPATASALVDAVDGFATDFVADRLVLFESRTGGGPARYEPVAEIVLDVPGPPAVLPSSPEAIARDPRPTGKPDRP